MVVDLNCPRGSPQIRDNLRMAEFADKYEVVHNLTEYKDKDLFGSV